MRRVINVGLAQEHSGQEITQAFQSLKSDNFSEMMRLNIHHESGSRWNFLDSFFPMKPRITLKNTLLVHKLRRIVLRDPLPFIKLAVGTFVPTETYKQIAIVVHFWDGFTWPPKRERRPFTVEELPYFMSLLKNFYAQLEAQVETSMTSS